MMEDIIVSEDKSDLTLISDLEEFVHEDDPEVNSLFNSGDSSSAANSTESDDLDLSDDDDNLDLSDDDDNLEA